MHLKKEEKLRDGRKLFIFWSNDKGKGKGNCTIQLVDKNQIRRLTAKDTTLIIKEVYTTCWKGDVNFSKRIQDILGIVETDLVRYKSIKKFDETLRNGAFNKSQSAFDLLWKSIDENNKGEFGIVTKKEMKTFAEKIYFKGWYDCTNWQIEKDLIITKNARAE